MKNQQEKQNRVVALLYSFGGHAIMLILAFFVISWKAPDPPLGALGGNLALGFDNEGSGDEQPTAPIGSEKAKATEEAEPKPEEQKQPEETTPQEVKETAKVETEKVVTSKDEESPVTVKENKKEEEKKPVVEKPKEVVVEKPAAVYKPATTTTSNDKSTSDRAGKPGNQGDDVGKTGDKGNPNGNEKGKALYGTPGNGGNGNGGSSLDISGWQWDDRPNPVISTSESGRVVFEIKVDENGDILSIKTLERSISAEAEQICRKSVEKLSFIKTGTNVPEVSTGKITFVIRSK
ncbi:MAG TPA: hypothetical protein VIM65_03640 [Cyclobacteriaceae bacterium]